MINDRFCYKGFNIRDGLTRVKGRDDSELKVFLAGGCAEEVLVIKDEVGSVDGFGGETEKPRFVYE